MATRFANNLIPIYASVRIWAQFIEDTFITTGGWVATTDTGQTLPASLPTTSGANTPQGFRIYKMNDTLQSTAPIFFKIWWGGGSFTGNGLSMWFSVGTGSDGAGNLTGVFIPQTQIANGNTSSSVTGNNYGSADVNRCTFATFIQATGAFHITFGIERTKDSSGGDTGDGVLVAGTSNGQSAFGLSAYGIRAGGVQPVMENACAYILSVNNPSQIFTPGDIGVGILIPFKGVAQQPGTNWCFTNNNDVSVQGFISLTIYGASRTYQQLDNSGVRKTIGGSFISDTNARVLMRYD
jgi:hypothetical protein